MNSPAMDLAKYVASAADAYSGIGDWAGQDDFDVYAAVEPVEPSNVVTFYDTGGTGPDTDEQDLNVVNVQVRVRCEDYETGWAVQEAIRDLLLGTAPLTCEDSTFVGLRMENHVNSIGRDENQRHILTANYVAIREI